MAERRKQFHAKTSPIATFDARRSALNIKLAGSIDVTLNAALNSSISALKIATSSWYVNYFEEEILKFKLNFFLNRTARSIAVKKVAILETALLVIVYRLMS